MTRKDDQILEYSLFISWAAAFIATLGSLYFSEVMKYIPCDLCWVQRIFMYPLVIIIGVAIVKKDYNIYRYVLPLSIIGGLISIYHYMLQKMPVIANYANTCGVVPCTGEYINWLGFITIPLLALTAFSIITVSNILLIKFVHKGGK